MYERYLENLKPGLVEELKAKTEHFEPDFALVKLEIKTHLLRISTPTR